MRLEALCNSLQPLHVRIMWLYSSKSMSGTIRVLSLSLSPSQTIFLSMFSTVSLSHIHTHTLSFSLSLTLSHTHTHTHTHTKHVLNREYQSLFLAIQLSLPQILTSLLFSQIHVLNIYQDLSKIFLNRFAD